MITVRGFVEHPSVKSLLKVQNPQNKVLKPCDAALLQRLRRKTKKLSRMVKQLMEEKKESPDQDKGAENELGETLTCSHAPTYITAMSCLLCSHVPPTLQPAMSHITLQPCPTHFAAMSYQLCSHVPPTLQPAMSHPLCCQPCPTYFAAMFHPLCSHVPSTLQPAMPHLLHSQLETVCSLAGCWLFAMCPAFV